MSKCGKKVKNPCKMCLQPVTQKTGLQCQGACLSWVHYSCLNYTPGRIKDIKDGIIKVTCPCPDCKTKFPKEYRTDEPYSCSNEQCPANRPPKCENMACPSNVDFPAPPAGHNMSPLSECGPQCQKHGSAQTNVQFSPPSQNSSSSCCESPCPSSGDVQRGGGGGGAADFPPMQVVEQMCNTVGQLANQINDLMTRMKQAMQEPMGAGGGKGGAGKGCCPKNQKSCSQKGPKSNCPKPCYCPGNPAARK